MNNNQHTLKQDAELINSNSGKKDLRLNEEMHPSDRNQPGKGVKESKQFNSNCEFPINHNK